MDGLQFRSILNTNFNNIKNVLDSLDSGDSNVIYTDIEIETTEGIDVGTYQVVVNDNGVKVLRLEDSWQLVCQFKSEGGSSESVIITDENGGVAYPAVEDEELDYMPIGYVDGIRYLAGTPVEGGDPVHCVGWLVGNTLKKSGRIHLEETLTAGLPVYVSNIGDGWTVEKPENEGNLVQVIGFVSDDGSYIDIDIQAWCIAE